MTLTDTAQSQSESISLEFEFHHSPEREWRALTDPAQLAEWLLPVVDFKLEPGGGVPVQDATVSRLGRHRELPVARDRTYRKLSYTWSVPFHEPVVGEHGWSRRSR